MQNVQNADTQRVMNLVDLYRTKVGKESQIAKDAKEEYESLSEMGFWAEGPHTERWIKYLKVNEQLLGHFYAEVAGEDADREILGQLLPDIYDKNVYTEEDEAFLKAHFKDLVNYIIKTPCDEDLKWVSRHDGKDSLVVPDEVLELIDSRAGISVGSKIFNPCAGFAQFINFFKGCKFYCDDKNAWMQLAILANNADVEILEDGVLPSSYDFVVSYLYGVLDEDTPNDMGKEDKRTRILISAYDHLKDGGRMILLCPNNLLWSMYPHNLDFFTKDDKGNMNKVLNPVRDIHYEFRHRLIDDGSIVEIIQLPHVMSSNANTRDYSLLIVEKGRNEGVSSMIDARYAFKETKKTNFSKILDLNAFNVMLQNHGCDTKTGLRRMVEVSTSDLDEQMMIPQVYVIERPSENEHPVPLSSLCQLVTERVRDVKYDLPIDTPWVKNKDLSATYQGALEIDNLDKANCPNRPSGKSFKDLTGAGSLLFYTSVDSSATPEDFHIAQYRSCTYLDGNRDAILLYLSGDRIATALFRATGCPIVAGDGFGGEKILVFYPSEGIDALSLLSILRMPIVYRQILAYKEFGIYGEYGHLNDILVPTDQRVIYDEKQRMLKEQDVVGTLENSLNNMRKSVRMRKHALTQSLSSIEAMFYALNSFRNRKEGVISDDDIISRREGTTVKEAFEFISKGINDMMPALEHIADVEYTFTMPAWIDPEKFMEDYIATNRKGWLNFEPVITWKKGHNQAKDNIFEMDSETGMPLRDLPPILLKGDSLVEFFFPKDALRRIFNNIVSNAQAHGFTEKTRKDYKLKFSWRSDKTDLFIEIENNGTPIPTDRDTSSLLEYGVSTALHHDGHNGIGCNEIDEIMRRYDGDVHIISFPDSEYTVKYVLRFKIPSTPILS